MRVGKGAMEALKAHYEGESLMSQAHTQAYEMIKMVTYRGETQN
jgi:hypothetical protein